MVARTIQLPNIRKLFIPDPGYAIIDADFDQADARVVAWDANAPKLKAIFNDPTKDLHDENSLTLFKRLDKYHRSLAKRGVHATNYYITARSLGKSLGITTGAAQHFMDTWFGAHPQIPEWHRRIEREVCTSRIIRNAFGYRKIFYDRPDRILPEAIAWIPQSTVAIAINKALYNIYKNLPEVQILIQVHDSLVMQVQKRKFRELLPKIKEQMTIRIPYEDPLYLPVSAEASTKSWGHKKPVTWEGDFENLSVQNAAGF